MPERHWSQKYIGLRYEKDTFNCAHLVERVLRERFGRALELPKENQGYRANARRIAAETAAYAVPAESPQEGDGVLLIARGHDCHLGVYCVAVGEPWVLHNWQAFGSVCLHRLRELELRGLRLEGVYRWT